MKSPDHGLRGRLFPYRPKPVGQPVGRSRPPRKRYEGPLEQRAQAALQDGDAVARHQGDAPGARPEALAPAREAAIVRRPSGMTPAMRLAAFPPKDAALRAGPRPRGAR